MKHERSTYRDLDQLKKKAEQPGVHLPFATDISMLRESLSFGMVTVPNRIGVVPMEGADVLPGGSPSKFTTRRCARELMGESGLIWLEAIPTVPEGRSSTHRLVLIRDNLNHYRRLTEEIKETGQRENGFAPYLVIQASHDGRYSNPQGRPAPLIAYRHPRYEKLCPTDDSCIVSGDYPKFLEEKFGEAAVFAREAGLDAVDIKSCHGYLLAKLTFTYSHTGRYGESFEDRTRLLRNGIAAAKNYEDDRFLVITRIRIFDGSAYPYGFGVKEGNEGVLDVKESTRLVRSLYENYGLSMINPTMENPYVSTYVTHLYDFGKYVPDGHPLFGTIRFISGIRAVKKVVPSMVISASGPSYLRQYSDPSVAGTIEEGLCDQMLFGRMSFANPELPEQIMETRRMDPKRICVACEKCGGLIRTGKLTGYVVRDTAPYLEYYREYLEEIKRK